MRFRVVKHTNNFSRVGIHAVISMTSFVLEKYFEQLDFSVRGSVEP